MPNFPPSQVAGYVPCMERDFLPHLAGWLMWTSAVVGLLLLGHLNGWPDRLHQQGWIALGLLGCWRYGWAIANLGRAAWYQGITYPALRQQARMTEQQHGHLPLAVLVTAYRMPPAVYHAMVKALLREAKAAPVPVTLLLSVGSVLEEQEAIWLYQANGSPGHVRLVLMRQQGNGKRPALAEGLRRLRQCGLPEDALLVLMDGDTVLRPGGLAGFGGFFRADPRLGAVTVDNHPLGNGGLWVRAWHGLRMRQRHVLMGSQALSGRLLVLTGRFSVYRASIALDPAFIQRLEHDTLTHWRYGAVPFVTGDDKSTWFELLQQGWVMRYLPDVKVDCCEPQVKPDLLGHSLPLMQRWFGNMLRNSDRARELGPRRMPLFTWWSLVDQRLSMWTGLLAPLGFIILGVTHHIAFLWGYALWVLLTRMVFAGLTGLLAGGFSPLWPFLLFYNQIIGCAVKVRCLFRLPVQEWTRQAVGRQPYRMSPKQLRVAGLFETTAWLVLLVVAAMLGGFMPTLKIL